MRNHVVIGAPRVNAHPPPGNVPKPRPISKPARVYLDYSDFVECVGISTMCLYFLCVLMFLKVFPSSLICPSPL